MVWWKHVTPLLRRIRNCQIYYYYYYYYYYIFMVSAITSGGPTDTKIYYQ